MTEIFSEYVKNFNNYEYQKNDSYLIKLISEDSKIDTNYKKKHMFHATRSRAKIDLPEITKAILELYLFDYEGFLKLKFNQTTIQLKSEMYTFTLGDRVNELKNTLGETKYEDDRLNKAQQNIKTPLRKPKEYDFRQRQVIVTELNSFLNPFPV